mmetsp:Transcript_98171/g.247763  ORF Transcript_98171/g.247763 Transcript_98171/m.247763 type:complete len:296 (-) Transcript_98171:297-1184(-)
MSWIKESATLSAQSRPQTLSDLPERLPWASGSPRILPGIVPPDDYHMLSQDERKAFRSEYITDTMSDLPDRPSWASGPSSFLPGIVLPEDYHALDRGERKSYRSNYITDTLGDCSETLSGASQACDTRCGVGTAHLVHGFGDLEDDGRLHHQERGAFRPSHTTDTLYDLPDRPSRASGPQGLVTGILPPEDYHAPSQGERKALWSDHITDTLSDLLEASSWASHDDTSGARSQDISDSARHREGGDLEQGERLAYRSKHTSKLSDLLESFSWMAMALGEDNLCSGGALSSFDQEA